MPVMMTVKSLSRPFLSVVVVTTAINCADASRSGRAIASPSAAPLSEEAKLVAILEAEKAPYRACLDKVMAQYPVASVAPFSPPPNRKEARHILEEAKLALDRSVQGAALEKKCGEEFKVGIIPKLIAAGASPEAAETAYSDWLSYFMRGETPPPKK